MGTITIPVTLTIIGSGVYDVLNISTKLNQNFPNPFTHSTMISFNLATKLNKKAKIMIYNLKGQLVKTLLPLTTHHSPLTKVVWDGKDEKGKPVGSGIYLYRLSTRGGSASGRKVDDKIIDTKKCLLLK